MRQALGRRDVTIEDIVQLPSPGFTQPELLQFCPDGEGIAYIRALEEDGRKLLCRFDLRSHATEVMFGGQTDLVKVELSREAVLRQERQRTRVRGVWQYQWVRARRLLVIFDGQPFLADPVSGGYRALVAPDGGEVLDPQLAPDGQLVAYVSDRELYVADFEGKATPRQLTFSARYQGKSNGLAEFVAQEEMGRQHGFWWSPSGVWLAFEEVDERRIAPLRIHHYSDALVGPDAEEQHRYPFAGRENVVFRVGVVAAQGGTVRWVPVPVQEDCYLAQVHWGEGDCLFLQIQRRQQDILWLFRYDPVKETTSLLLEERAPDWLNLNQLFTPLRDGSFLWGSERTGFQHIYRYTPDDRIGVPLTSGEWMVESVEGVDEGAGLVYVTGTEASPLERHLYAVPLTGGGELWRMTVEPGIHQVVVAPERGHFIDVWYCLEQPPVVTCRMLRQGTVAHQIFMPSDPRLERLKLEPPTIVELMAIDGQRLYGALWCPPKEETGPFPIVIQVYGGPHAQMVMNSWGLTSNVRAQYLAQHGFVVLALDNRGGYHRGHAFERVIWRRLGTIEVEDQVLGVRWLAEQGLGDPGRVGIYGWSYGGYMVLRCMMLRPDVFHVGVAGAPVTHWDGYDTHYTERYMGKPEENAEGYEQSSAWYRIEQLRGKLLLLHGLIDENVHFRHTMRLIDRLIQHHKPFEAGVIPRERHGVRSEAARRYVEERLLQFLQQHLMATGTDG